MPDETALMQAIKTTCGAALDDFAPSTSVPVAFWAALTANESGYDVAHGTPLAKITRREPAVFTHLALVAGGFQPKYGSIALSDLVQAEDRQTARPSACHVPFALQAPSVINSVHSNPQTPLTVADLLAWATSWGWTQLMGYHAIEWRVDVADLVDPEKHYRFAAKLMAGFVEQYQLDPTKDFDQMARCWNTGSPAGKTYDPAYVANLLARMEAWGKL
jgi:hypothetical protein